VKNELLRLPLQPQSQRPRAETTAITETVPGRKISTRRTGRTDVVTSMTHHLTLVG
jgi:hypothetical protein